MVMREGLDQLDQEEKGDQDEVEQMINHSTVKGLNKRKRRRTLNASSQSSARSNKKLYGKIESQQYEQDESEVWWHHQLQRHFQDRGRWWTFARKTEFLRWSLTLLTGMSCGVVALLVSHFTKTLTQFKYKTFHGLVKLESEHALPMGSSFAMLFVANLFFGLLAWFFVYMEPMAAGSGIPEIKCYLNGLNIPRLLDLKTLVCKAMGLVFACSAGLPLGKEGPMVHIGAIVAAGISQGKSATLGIETNFSNFQDLRNDREKRDFVACGSACGVAAAFGAPIGGVLFSLEEGASFWSTTLTWRCFFCAMTTVFSLYLFNTAKSLFGHSDITAMFSFGEFFSLQSEQSNYSVWELSLFVLIGYIGGLIGAFFNYIVHLCYQYRTKYVYNMQRKVIEICILTSIMSIISYAMPLIWNKCTPLPVNMEGWSDEEKGLVDELIPLYCNAETEYNELASLYLTDSDTAIGQLFHFREIGNHNDYTFSSAALLIFFIPYIILACLICNTAVPAGMFVPCLLSGATFGRLVGHLLHLVDNTRGTFADSGTYALMGAAAITAGITRMTISLTVMILEATGDMQYVLPLMLTVLTARSIGNIFTEGVYDMYIYNRNLSYIDEDENSSWTNQVEIHDLTVKDIMSTELVTMSSIVQIGHALDVLEKGTHHCYPIVDEDEPGILQGTISRKVLCTLLKHKAYNPELPQLNFNPASSRSDYNLNEHINKAEQIRMSPLVNWGTLECIYPHYPDLDDIHISDAERTYWLDLRPYIDSSPYIINEHASIQRTYRMFRTLGLRHLLVINKHQQLQGIVTRSDLVAVHQYTHSQHKALKKAKQDKENKLHLSQSSDSEDPDSTYTGKYSAKQTLQGLHREKSRRNTILTPTIELSIPTAPISQLGNRTSQGRMHLAHSDDDDDNNTGVSSNEIESLPLTNGKRGGSTLYDPEYVHGNDL